MKASSSPTGGVLLGIILIGLLAFGFYSCASSKTSSSIGVLPRQLTIALAPDGGVLADAIGVELFNRGFKVIDTKQMSSFFVRYNLTEIEFLKPENLALIKKEGIDAILSVKSVAGYDSKPQSASVRINSTDTEGKIIAAVSWENGWGGGEGSALDRSKRKDITGAAREIVDALLRPKR